MNQLKEKINVRYIGTLAACILAALLIGAVLMILTGFNPLEAYGAMIEGSLGKSYDALSSGSCHGNWRKGRTL